MLSLIILGLLLPWSHGFHHQQRHTFLLRRNEERGVTSCSCGLPPVLFQTKHGRFDSENDSPLNFISFIHSRLDTSSAAGLKNVRTAGGGGIFGIGNIVKKVKALPQKVKTLPEDIQKLTWEDVKPMKRIKRLHDPITYLIINFLFARQHPKALKNMVFWLWSAFCIKWIRARYLFKIPVWDRQPNWNNIITSKEQEKDLKAYTCKVCGSTLFIAKTREFFFEGETGIGGLGCFACGAKGAENFVMDRDRIVEEVADIDDYFDYERPLDFISAAERRAVMKEAGGDEDKANELLVKRSNASASSESKETEEVTVNGSADGVMVDNNKAIVGEIEPEAPAKKEEGGEVSSSTKDIDVARDTLPSTSKPKSETAVKKSVKSSSSDCNDDDDDLDILGMDDY